MMHDCRIMRGALIDLAFDELSRERKLSLLVEIENCAECSSQYSGITEALYAVDEAATRALPGEAYWLAYDQALLERLKRAHGAEQRIERSPLWKQFLAARLPVPVPVAALVILLLIVSTTLSLRTRRSDDAVLLPTAPTPSETRVVEVPVIHEKIVTRTVYVERKGRQGRAATGQPTVNRAGEPRLVAREAAGATTSLTRTGLAGFQPADDVRLTIIKAREEKKR